MVKPLKESLEKVDGKIGELEKTRAGAYSELREQVKSAGHLATATAGGNGKPGQRFARAARARALGRDSIAARRRARRHACSIATSSNRKRWSPTDGRIRPDVIVRLPGNRTIVVDAKVPFDAFYESISTKDEVVRGAKLKDHARLVRTHIGSLEQEVVLGISAADAGVCVAVSAR